MKEAVRTLEREVLACVAGGGGGGGGRGGEVIPVLAALLCPHKVHIRRRTIEVRKVRPRTVVPLCPQVPNEL